MRTETLDRAFEIAAACTERPPGPAAVHSPSLVVVEEPLPERPRTRGDCVDGPRPCPWVSCRHNLYLDVRAVGTITRNFPDLEPEDMGASCALDEADRGGMTLEGVAERMGFTRERARQLEASGLRKIRLTREGQDLRDMERTEDTWHPLELFE